MIAITSRREGGELTSEGMRTIVESIAGEGTFLADIYDRMEPDLVENNGIRINSGILCHHGNIVYIKPNTYDIVNYENGNQGMKRKDLVVMRHSYNANTDTESDEWVVIKGTPTTGTPVAPEYNHGNMQEGAPIDDCPVFEIEFNGLNVVGVKKLIPVSNTIAELSNSNLFLKSHPIGSIYMTTDDRNPGNLFGGTWVAWGQGRVAIGVNTDDSDFNTAEKTGGEKTHTLTEAEMPSHAHTIYQQTKYQFVNSGGTDGVINWKNNYSYPVPTERAGGSLPHNNLQPYITCYMWKRTA